MNAQDSDTQNKKKVKRNTKIGHDERVARTNKKKQSKNPWKITELYFFGFHTQDSETQERRPHNEHADGKDFR